MFLQSDLYDHIVSGEAGEASPLMARIALNLGYDADLYPVDLTILKELRNFSWSRESCGLNEYFICDFIKSALMDDIRPWTDEEASRLQSFANSPKPVFSGFFSTIIYQS